MAEVTLMDYQSILATQGTELAGSTLLKVLDDFALNSHNASHPVASDNIGMSFISFQHTLISLAPIQILFSLHVQLFTLPEPGVLL